MSNKSLTALIVGVVLAIVLFVLLPLEQYVASIVVFVVAAGTDWIDGYWARKFGQITQLGRILDPFADKIIICGTFIFLAAAPGSGVHAWMTVAIVGRELLVTALRGFLEQQGSDFSASMAGKLKMVFQCIAVVASMLALQYGVVETAETADINPWFSTHGGTPPWLWWTLVLAVWLAVISTVYSGVGYIFAAVKLLRQ